ncbi:hypothetical protein AB0K51_10210 [Kitasatospora sp. NPDC049285]|uniref:hypothetical protein n=1 Tax=Kitasatospora sp. NPDC049285 TaxID=3157096 RepID=UPI00342485A4
MPSIAPEPEPWDAAERRGLSEDEVRPVFERAVGEAVPDLGALIAGAAEQGRAIRLRRRAAVLGTVAAVAGLAVGAGLLLRPAMPGGATAAVSALPVLPPLGAGTAAGAGTVGAAVEPTPLPSPSYPGEKVALTGPAAVMVLLSLLPADLRASEYAGQDESAGQGESAGQEGERSATRVVVVARVRVRAADGTDRGWIEVHLQSALAPAVSAPADAYGCTPRPKNGSCTGAPVPDGSFRQLRTDHRADGVSEHTADLLRADGVRIIATATGPAGGGPAPITLDRLAKLAQSPGWQPVIDRDAAVAAAAKLRPYQSLGSATIAPTPSRPPSGG